MKKTLVLIFLLGIKFCANGQIKNVSVAIKGNTTLIRSVSLTSKYASYTGPMSQYYTYIYYKTDESYTPKAGFDFSFKADYSITSKFFFSSGLILNYYRFNRSTVLSSYGVTQTVGTNAAKGVLIGSFYNGSVSITRDNVLVDSRSPKTDKSCTYLTVPILVGKSFHNEKLIVRAGVSCSYILDAYGYKLNLSSDFSSIEEKKTTQTSTYNSVLVNAVAETTYKLSKRIGIDFSFQKSFTPIYTKSNSVGKTRYNSLSLGVSYFLK
ncbi:MAG TPA: outer membrane beta-barrel protein [Cyclobacteriaceae bacterium]|jgi:hypothetical protein|nr:outer membrane beta-barrel protein [Cyclobacteriaceae bacterium]